MMAELAASLPSAGIGAVVGAVLMKGIAALVEAFKIGKDAEGKLDQLQASRITELERRMDAEQHDCRAKLDAVNNRLNVIAQVTVHVTAELRIHAPIPPRWIGPRAHCSAPSPSI